MRNIILAMCLFSSMAHAAPRGGWYAEFNNVDIPLNSTFNKCIVATSPIHYDGVIHVLSIDPRVQKACKSIQESQLGCLHDHRAPKYKSHRKSGATTDIAGTPAEVVCSCAGAPASCGG
jgi:hypothetical protein